MTVTATDPDGLTAVQGFQVTVETPNRAPEAVGTIPPQTMTAGQTATVNVVSFFSDPDGDALSYSASTSDTAIVAADMSGSVLTLAGVAAGTATVTVTATDPDGLTATQSAAVTVRASESDRDILRIFYEATGGESWTRSDNWLTDAPLNEWHGVTANASGRVTGLSLFGNHLEGSLPDELGRLSALDSLRIEGEDGLVGTVPAELGNLAKLNYLSLSRNGLSGPIPAEMGQLARLSVLGLGGNALTGSIPGSIGNLRRLTELYLWGNRLTGTIPVELGRLTRLRTLDLSSNDTASSGMATRVVVADEASDALGREALRNIVTEPYTGRGGERAAVSGATGLTGPIPAELGNLANLTVLYLYSNGLTGPIPPELGNLADLTDLSLYSNDLTGPIPAELGDLADLKELGLTSNLLTGPIPPELGNLTNLTLLSLYSNDLTGPIPPELGNLANLTDLYLYSNDLTGPIPPELGNLANLMGLLLHDNADLTGPLPLELKGLPLQLFFYHNTDLCVPVDESFRAWLGSVQNHRGTDVDCPP